MYTFLSLFLRFSDSGRAKLVWRQEEHWIFVAGICDWPVGRLGGAETSSVGTERRRHLGRPKEPAVAVGRRATPSSWAVEAERELLSSAAG
jgi:hypothetical protein